MQDFWITSCSVCGMVFEQCRVGACGRRRTICDRIVCERARHWRRVNPGKSIPEWLTNKWRDLYGETRRTIRQPGPRTIALEQRLADRENGEFLRVQRAAWVTRVRHAAFVNPEMTWELLAERFGVDAGQVRNVCMDIPREPDHWTQRRSA